ncbi:hypothetical protein BU15DRAFT_68329 [Melanogaster broomeanus]|nr:hypothetical protein BU15DRAFT_68329 [Melanogaster broomeanus]
MSEMSLKEDHSTNPEEGAIQIPSTENEALEEVARGIFRITLQDATSNSMGDGTLARGGDEQLMPPPSMKIPEFASSTLMLAPPTLGTAAHDNENDDFTILYSLDHELHTRVTRALELVDSLDTQGAQNRVLDTMEGEELWLEEVRKQLETMGILGE